MKKAFSLIELILAIVIVGIGVSAIPAITSVSAKANAQSILSEVITSTRIYIDDILLEPWNSKLSEGFVDASGATLYSGILYTGNGDERFECTHDKTRESTKSPCSFNRHKAETEKTEGGVTTLKGIEAYGASSNCVESKENTYDGINCKQGATAELKVDGDAANFKNAFEIQITTEVEYVTIDDNSGEKTIHATFSPNNKANGGTSNALMVRTTTKPLNGDEITEDVKEISLTSFTFNIGSEPR